MNCGKLPDRSHPYCLSGDERLAPQIQVVFLLQGGKTCVEYNPPPNQTIYLSQVFFFNGHHTTSLQNLLDYRWEDLSFFTLILKP